MASSPSSLSHCTPLLPSQILSPPLHNFTFFTKLPLRTSTISLPVLSCSASTNHVPFTEQDLLHAVAESEGGTLPAVRTFENDLARLTLLGDVDFEQALTAAAADGGDVAADHLDSGRSAMVVETVFPGSSDDHSTVSTRLFLPARKVKEKARKLKSFLTKDIEFGTTSEKILAMTFRQVVIRQLGSFELLLARPGIERNMKNLEKPREVPPCFILSSSNEQVISVLAEAICASALQSTERDFLDNVLGKTSANFFHWFQKPKRFASKDSSVILYKLSEHEMIKRAQKHFKSRKEGLNMRKLKPKYHWWTPSALSQLEKIGGPEFSAWASEYVPAYRLEIITDKYGDVKFEGWKKAAENRWQVLLTHSQMVGLAGILDMYYEDIYSLPNKQLSCGVVTNFANLSNKKRSSSLLRVLSITLASGIFLIAVSALGQLYLPHLRKEGKHPRDLRSLESSQVELVLHQSLDAEKLDLFSISVVRKIKDAFGWPGDIITEPGVGAWTGEVPSYLLTMSGVNSSSEGTSVSSVSKEELDADVKVSAQDIASYQVVLSNDGKIVGFQPTSMVAVNHWASNPLAKELYSGKKLSPGLIEPCPNIDQPDEVAIIELLMSVNPENHFALARPVQIQ